MNFKPGDRVKCTYSQKWNNSGMKPLFPSKIGTIHTVNYKTNSHGQYVHLIRWDDGEIKPQHPSYLRKLSKLEEVLK